MCCAILLMLIQQGFLWLAKLAFISHRKNKCLLFQFLIHKDSKKAAYFQSTHEIYLDDEFRESRLTPTERFSQRFFVCVFVCMFVRSLIHFCWLLVIFHCGYFTVCFTFSNIWQLSRWFGCYCCCCFFGVWYSRILHQTQRKWEKLRERAKGIYGSREEKSNQWKQRK